MCRQAKVLYVSGEESLRQIRLRADRLHISSSDLFVLAETDLEEIIEETACVTRLSSIPEIHPPTRSATVGYACLSASVSATNIKISPSFRRTHRKNPKSIPLTPHYFMGILPNYTLGLDKSK